MAGIEPFDLRSPTDGPGCDPFKAVELYAFFNIRVAHMVYDKLTIHRSGSRPLPFTMPYLQKNEFVRLVGPYFARSLEVEVDLGKDSDFPRALERLAGFPIPPSYIACRTVPRSPYDEHGNPQYHGVGNLHITWLLEERIQWKTDETGVKHWTRDMYHRVQKQITKLLYGDTMFKFSLTRSPWATGDKVEYRTHVLDLTPVSLFDLDRSSKQYQRLLENIDVDPVELRGEESRLKLKGGEKREVQTLGGRIQHSDGSWIHAPVVNDAGTLQRNEWLFEHGRFWAYGLARDLISKGEEVSYHAVLTPLLRELAKVNGLIPSVTAGKPCLDMIEVKDIAFSIARFVSSQYVPSLETSTDRRGKSRYAVARGRKAQELHPELKENLTPEKWHRTIREKNAGASQERQRRVLRVVELLRESKSRREIRDALMRDFELEVLSLDTVKRYVREARRIIEEEGHERSL